MPGAFSGIREGRGPPHRAVGRANDLCGNASGYFSISGRKGGIHAGRRKFFSLSPNPANSCRVGTRDLERARALFMIKISGNDP